MRLTPSGWKEKHNQGSYKEEPLPETHECSLNERQQKSTSVWLIKKVYGTVSTYMSQMRFSHENNRYHHRLRGKGQNTETPG